MNNEIKVIVKDERSSQEVQGGGGANTGTGGNSLPNQEAQSNKGSHTAQTVATLIAMRSISYTTSNVGKWTGNSRNQVMVNNVEKAVGYAAAFAANVYVGIATVALDVGTTAASYIYDNSWNTYSSKQAQAKYGGKGGYRK